MPQKNFFYGASRSDIGEKTPIKKVSKEPEKNEIINIKTPLESRMNTYSKKELEKLSKNIGKILNDPEKTKGLMTGTVTIEGK